MRTRPRTLVVLLAAAMLLSGAGPRALQGDRLDDWIRGEMARQNIPGLTVAVVQDGDLLESRAYGVADRGTGAPVTVDTVFKVASVSKQFIAAGIMLLVQDGLLELDTPVSDIIEDVPESWSEITIGAMLSHTAGLVREGPGFDTDRVQPDIVVIRSAYDEPLLFAPGDDWTYSNLGYFTLAEVISRVSGEPWPAFIARRVFAPAEMEDTTTTNAPGAMANGATGHLDNNDLRPAADWPALRPSGAFVSTISDMVRWETALREAAILELATQQEMWEPARLNDGTERPYGFGWQLGEVDDHRMVFHLGGLTGFRSAFARFVDDGLSVVVLMNLSDVDIYAVVRGVAQIYLQDDAVQGTISIR